MMAYITKDLNVSGEVIEKITKARLKRYKQCMDNVDAGVIKLLTELKKQKYKTAIISNADAVDVYYWNQSGIRRYFDASVFSFDAGVMKPDKEIYASATNRIRENADNCIFVGDGGHNELSGAKNTGLETVLSTHFIKDLWPQRIEYLKKDADHVISEIYDLLKII